MSSASLRIYIMAQILIPTSLISKSTHRLIPRRRLIPTLRKVFGVTERRRSSVVGVPANSHYFVIIEQVTFVSSEPLPPEFSHVLEFREVKYNLYSHSFLHLGQVSFNLYYYSKFIIALFTSITPFAS
ncbi:uncharacterized protein LOC109850694 [Asparagus officinalis]|uniref:uncharacterized protein LOC109850694 n=1 Tax=Asparagus officinalis TaxID=4686 RepID=UPI00098E35D3|nr:uncharacterized protein LOC109850694 [Asparagus officinalis]